MATRSTADHPGGLGDLISVTECMWISVCMWFWQVMLVDRVNRGIGGIFSLEVFASMKVAQFINVNL